MVFIAAKYDYYSNPFYFTDTTVIFVFLRPEQIVLFLLTPVSYSVSVIRLWTHQGYSMFGIKANKSG